VEIDSYCEQYNIIGQVELEVGYHGKLEKTFKLILGELGARK